MPVQLVGAGCAAAAAGLCVHALAAADDKVAVPALLPGTAECSWGGGDSHGHCRMGFVFGSVPTARV